MATAEQMQQQIVTLNASLIEMTGNLQIAQNGLREAQNSILGLEQKSATGGGSGSGAGGYVENRRIADNKMLMPEPFVKAEDFRDWASEMLDYVERFSEDIAKAMKDAAQQATEIDDQALAIVPAADVRDVYAVLRKLLKHPEAKSKLLMTRNKNVAEVWRKLTRWFYPQSVGSAAASVRPFLR